MPESGYANALRAAVAHTRRKCWLLVARCKPGCLLIIQSAYLARCRYLLSPPRLRRADKRIACAFTNTTDDCPRTTRVNPEPVSPQGADGESALQSIVMRVGAGYASGMMCLSSRLCSLCPMRRIRRHCGVFTASNFPRVLALSRPLPCIPLHESQGLLQNKKPAAVTHTGFAILSTC